MIEKATQINQNNFIKPTQKIVFINNKGGVGKTTLAYNIACKLSEKGNKVLLVDADPQCNLTLLSLGIYKYQELGLFQNNTIYNVIENLILGMGDINMSILPTNIKNNLDILPGNLKFTDFDELLTTSYGEINGTGAKRGFMVVSGLKRYLDEISIQKGYNIVIIDVSPSMTGSLNKTILLSADFFLTICNPDLFSTQGVINLGTKIKKRRHEQTTINSIAKRDSAIPASQLLDGGNAFLGYVLNNYNVYRDSPISDHSTWLENIKPKIKEYLSELSRNGLVTVSHEQTLGMTQDYGRISTIGQQKNKPMYEVERHEIEAPGSIELLGKCKTQIDELSNIIIERLSKWGN